MDEHYAQDAVYYLVVFRSLREKKQYSTETEFPIDNENLFRSQCHLISVKKKSSSMDKLCTLKKSSSMDKLCTLKDS